MNLNSPAWQAMIADNTTHEDRGRTYSLFGMVSQISSQLSPSVGAVLWEIFNPAAPILFDALIRGATAIFLLLFLKESTNS